MAKSFQKLVYTFSDAKFRTIWNSLSPKHLGIINLVLKPTPVFFTLNSQTITSLCLSELTVLPLSSRIHAFQKRILEAVSFFASARHELEALNYQRGLGSVWFTLSFAEQHWHDVSRHVMGLGLA